MISQPIHFKIVCMGDSLTEGYEIPISARWSDLLQKELSIPVINSGISGDTTGGMLSRFHQMVIIHHPTHVIIMGGTNDLWFGIPEQLVISNILAMTKLARHHGIISIIGLPTLFFPELAPSFSPIFINAKSFLEDLLRFRDKLREVAESKDLEVIDFSLDMEEGMFLEDGLHPNVKGHFKMMENAKDRLLTILDTKH